MRPKWRLTTTGTIRHESAQAFGNSAEFSPGREGASQGCCARASDGRACGGGGCTCWRRNPRLLPFLFPLARPLRGRVFSFWREAAGCGFPPTPVFPLLRHRDCVKDRVRHTAKPRQRQMFKTVVLVAVLTTTLTACGANDAQRALIGAGVGAAVNRHLLGIKRVRA